LLRAYGTFPGKDGKIVYAREDGFTPGIFFNESVRGDQFADRYGGRANATEMRQQQLVNPRRRGWTRRRRLLGFLGALAAISTVFSLSAGQALATTVHCGDVIAQDTTLDSDLACSSEPMLTIGADNVTLDLGGHALRWEGSGIGTAVSSTCCPPRAGVTVKDGTIERGDINLVLPDRPTVRNLRLIGGGSILFDASTASIEDNEILGVGDSGGIYVGTFGGNQIRRNRIIGGFGISLQFASGSVMNNVIKAGRGRRGAVEVYRSSAEIARNQILDNESDGIDVNTHAEALVHDNVISGNREGVFIADAEVSLWANVVVRNSANGVTAEQPFDSACLTAYGNTISRNGANGVLFGVGSWYACRAELVHNRISGNALDGLHAYALPDSGAPVPLLIVGNRTDRNGDDGIDTAFSPTTLTRNHAWFNADLGIEAVPGVSGGGNWAKHNGNPAQCVPGSLCSATGKPKK
jgi:hypothetical protein